LDAFVDAGFNFVDTADVYARWVKGNKGHESETIIGNWIKSSGKRDKIVLATKCGLMVEKNGLAPGYIKECVDGALKRLTTDRIDLFQSHRDDPNTPLADTLGAYDELIKAGKIRAIGASNYSAPRLQEALDASAKHGLARYESLQPEYNMFERAGYEAALEPL